MGIKPQEWQYVPGKKPEWIKRGHRGGTYTTEIKRSHDERAPGWVNRQFVRNYAAQNTGTEQNKRVLRKFVGDEEYREYDGKIEIYNMKTHHWAELPLGDYIVKGSWLENEVVSKDKFETMYDKDWACRNGLYGGAKWGDYEGLDNE